MSSELSQQLSTIHMAFAGCIALTLFRLSRYLTFQSRLPYPPGPLPLPIIGNLLDMPTSELALTWTKFGEQYGPLTWLNVAGRPFLVLNSLEAAKELLDGRGSSYSDRPRFVMAVELVGLGWLTSFSRFGPGWRAQRTLLKHALSAGVVTRDYGTLFARKAKQYLECLLDRPDNFLVDLRRISAENIIELSYGRLGDEQGRDYVQLNRYVLDVVHKVSQGYVVDLIPALRYLPSWFPGMNFKRDASKWSREIDDINRSRFGTAWESLISGAPDVQSCFMVNNLRELNDEQEGFDGPEKSKDRQDAIRNSGVFFSSGVVIRSTAGADTTYDSIHALLLAMTLFPSAQEKACAEIDRVEGPERLPTLDDLEKMLYLRLTKRRRN